MTFQTMRTDAGPRLPRHSPAPEHPLGLRRPPAGAAGGGALQALPLEKGVSLRFFSREEFDLPGGFIRRGTWPSTPTALSWTS